MKINSSAITGKIKHSLTRKNNKLLLALDDFNNTSIKACAGIRGKKALVMGVNNFGDPLHTFPNTSDESSVRNKKMKKMAKKLGAEAMATQGYNPIPARPFFSDASYKIGDRAKGNIDNYLSKHIPRLLAAGISGTFKKGGRRTATPKEFYEGLSNVMANNIRENWKESSSLYEKNSDATIANKGNLPPLHGGHFEEDGIEGWIK